MLVSGRVLFWLGVCMVFPSPKDWILEEPGISNRTSHKLPRHWLGALHASFQGHIQWLFLVPLNDGRDYRTPQKAIYMW